jgi:DNA-binding IclR family transcriptional regulator
MTVTAVRTPEVGPDAGVRSVVRALDLLALLDDERPWSIADLTRASSLPKTTVLRLVATLEHRGLLWTRPDRRVCLGAGLLRWARAAENAWRLPEPAREIMRGLAASCRETVNVYVRQGTARVCIAQQEGPQSIRHVVRVGDALPLWAGAASKVLLADAPAELLDHVAALSPQGPGLASALRAGARAARRRGYAVSHGERETGASGLAAPIVDHHGNVIAALALGGPTPRFTARDVARFAPAVVGAARQVSGLGVGPASTED